MSNISINLALMCQGSNNLLNKDVCIVIFYFMGQSQTKPPLPYESKAIYFKCNTVGNCQKFKTDKTKSNTDAMETAELKYKFTIYKSADVSGVNRGIDSDGDYIQIAKETGLWYKVDKLIQANDSYCVVECIQTTEDPEKPNSNAGQPLSYSALL
jgi:hypothetical protein